MTPEWWDVGSSVVVALCLEDLVAPVRVPGPFLSFLLFLLLPSESLSGSESGFDIKKPV